MVSVGSIWGDAGLKINHGDFAQYAAKLKSAEKQIGDFKSTSQGLIAGAFTLPAAAVAGMAAYGTTIASSYEDAGMTLETLYGSQERARDEFTWLSNFAAPTPFEFPELLEVDGLLKNAGISAQDYIGTIGDAASAQGKSIGQVTEAIIDAQTGEYERLKELGINSTEIIKKNYEQLGVAAEDVGKLALTSIDKNGKQIVSVVDQNNKQMISSTILGLWNDKYAGAMEKRSKSFSGMMSTIKDNLKNGLAEMAGFDMQSMSVESFSLLGALKGLAGIAVTVTGAFSGMSEPMQTFVIIGAIGGATALALAGGLIAASAAGITTAGVMGALSLAVNSVLWPAALIVRTLALVAAGLVYLDKKTGIVSWSWQFFKDVVTITVDTISNIVGRLRDWIVIKIDEIRRAIDSMIPDGWIETISGITGTVGGFFDRLAGGVHTKAEDIRTDESNVGSSASSMKDTVVGAIDTIIPKFGGAGDAAGTMGLKVDGVKTPVANAAGAMSSTIGTLGSYAGAFQTIGSRAGDAAGAVENAASRIGAAYKTAASDIGNIASLAGKWNTTAKLGVSSGGGSGTGEGRVKVKSNPTMYTQHEMDARKANNRVVNNVKIQNYNEAKKSDTVKIKRATGG